ncbi:MAG: 30S ribosomal protein S3 [Candidatus Nealsonbacteria bacterium]
MTHKVHPKAYRLKETDDWDTRGYYKNLAEYLEEDFRVREFLNKKIGKFGVEKIEIERFPGKLNIIVFSARPGLIIGRGGEGVEKLKKELETKVLKKIIKKEEEIKGKGKNKENKLSVDKSNDKMDIKIDIKEVRDFWSSANLVGQWVAQRLEKRIPYRKALKQGLSKAITNKGIEGVRIELAGRLNGAEIARREWVAKGNLPRQTIRADIDYAKIEAHCTYGIIGIKVWIYKGEKFR